MIDLWRKMRELHIIIAQHPRRNMIRQGMFQQFEAIEGRDGEEEELLGYFLKRDYSESSQHVLGFVFPTSALFLNRPGYPRISSGFTPWLVARKLDTTVEHILAASFEDCVQKGGSGVECWDRQPLLESTPYLQAVADWVVESSCGFDFILQPWMRDFEIAEYRTYMVGGGSARGLPNDTVTVYTPVGEGMDKVVLPYGSFVNQKFKATEANKVRLIDQNAPDDRVFSKQPYASPGASSLLVWAAGNASQAISEFRDGVMTAWQSVWVRADTLMLPVLSCNGVIVETRCDPFFRTGADCSCHGKDLEGTIEMHPFINEFDSWAFTAGIFLDYWKNIFPVSSPATDPDSLHAAGVTTSWGYRFAEKVLQGAIRAFHSRAS
eukprot:jgi/Botrbrau1/17010/Bobra.49_2s0068.1